MEFPQTEWSVVAKATLDGATAGQAALEKLCKDYWRPVRDFLLRRGWREGDAEDLTQDFFRQLAHSRAWQRADRQRGKFRTFLLGMLMRVLARHQRHGLAEKRGSGQPLISLEALEEAGAEQAGASGDEEAARHFDESWALHVMEAALDALGSEWEAGGRAADFAVLMNYLPIGRETPNHEDTAAALNLSPTAVRSAVSRLRQRFRELVQTEVARTVSAPHEVGPEIRHLCNVLLAPGIEITFRATNATPPAKTDV
jgi:DNA-directed RNA polymerase specialized sigma24 family protein